MMISSEWQVGGIIWMGLDARRGDFFLEVVGQWDGGSEYCNESSRTPTVGRHDSELSAES